MIVIHVSTERLAYLGEFSENCSRAGEQGAERPALYEKKLIFYIYDKKNHIIVQPIAVDPHLLCSEQDKGGVRGQ